MTKIRESNGSTAELISRNIFSVRENLRNFPKYYCTTFRWDTMILHPTQKSCTCKGESISKAKLSLLILTTCEFSAQKINLNLQLNVSKEL